MAEYEALIDFSNALEAACVNLRKKLGDNTTPAPGSNGHQWSWDAAKITWEPKQGDKGPYEKTIFDLTNPAFKALNEDLNNHDDKLNRDGKFYWRFQNGNVGRKEVK